jgi:hypothetical protein
VISSFWGIKPAAIFTNSHGFRLIISWMAFEPSTCQASYMSETKASASLVREPRGRPWGLRTSPGLAGFRFAHPGFFGFS